MATPSVSKLGIREYLDRYYATFGGASAFERMYKDRTPVQDMASHFDVSRATIWAWSKAWRGLKDLSHNV